MNTRRFTIGLAMVLACAANAANAANLTWDIVPGTVGPGNGSVTGGNGTWNTTNGNWTTDGGVNNIAWNNTNGVNDTAILGGTAGTVTLGEPITVKTLSLTNLSTTNEYTIAGSTLNFAAGGSITTASTNSSNFTDFAFISSAITGAPNVVHGFSGGNNQLVFNPSSGSVALGTISGSGVTRLAGSTTGNSLVGTSNNNAKIKVSSGTWTLTGTVSTYENWIEGGNLIISTGTMTNTNRSTNLIGGTLHYNNPAAIRDNNAGAGGDNNFRLRGGSLDNTSGAAITTSTWNPGMNWEANWTFIGSNGADSNLYLGNGAVALYGGTRQVTVQNADTTLAVGGVLSNGGLTKAGLGTLELRGNSTYTGATTVSAGTLRITGTGSINGTSGITLNGGQLDYNSSVALTQGLTFTSGTLGGTNWTGSTLNNLTISANRTISPGNSPGTANTVDQTWDTDGTYQFEINSVAGSAGSDPGWDLLNGTGTLTITATSVDPFVIDLTSLDTSNNPNPVFNFDEAQGYEWLIADFANPVSSFDPSVFFVDDTNFANAYTGNFSVALGTSVPGGDNSQIYLTYVAVPEPTSIAILGAGVTLLGLHVARRRKA